MTTHTTKVWFVDGNIVEQEIPEEMIYKPEQEQLTDAERKSYQAGHNAGVAHHKQATKREWVKLNDEQYIQISDTTFHAGRGLVAFARGIEAKLKELNHE